MSSVPIFYDFQRETHLHSIVHGGDELGSTFNTIIL
ncbi:uncharacterized protein METZ01_LOCUS432532 [marine metagenome]|uniref:Uncharacterized protein n=1 Tax=marine metagenome TaxID=408172 RepID=A0A382YAX9_9ZZZZ